MKTTPILFSTEMVQAILRGDKTQTRRTNGLKSLNDSPDDWLFANMTCTDGHKKEFFFRHKYFEGDGCDLLIACPYGKVGDLLWVRETFGQGVSEKLYYKADKGIVDQLVLSWKPSIHMPKAAARIWLRITNIRVERLHEIIEEDAKAEGAPIGRVLGMGQIGGSHREGFIELWERINGFDSWSKNPWVWVVEFEVISKTGKS